MTPELINAVAGLWKLVLAVTFLLAVLLFRERISDQLRRLLRLHVKRGETEITVEGTTAGDTSLIVAQPIATGTTDPPPEIQSKPAALPAPSDQGSWFTNMFDSFLDRRLDDAKTAFEKLQASEPDAAARLRNEVLYYALRFTYGEDQTAMGELEKLSERAEVRADAFSWIAHCHKRLRAYSKAESAYREAIEASKSDEERSRNIASLAGLKAEIGQPQEAIELLTKAAQSMASQEARGALFVSLAGIYKDIGNTFARAVALEKAINLNPQNSSLRFDAAYAQSEAGLSQLSAANYDTLVNLEPDHPSAFNNLGVEAGHLGLSTLSVQFYRRAAEKNETLAMANLAFLFLQAGFTSEATELLSTARAEKNVHPNVGQAIATVAERSDTEEKRWKAVLSVGARHKLFFESYAEALFFPVSEQCFSGEWVSADGEHLTLSGDQSQISGEWSSGSKKRRIEGVPANRSARIKLKKWQTSPFSSQGGYFDAGEDGYGYVSEDKKRLYIVTVSRTEPVFLEFQKESSPQ